ncbi:Uncharacterized protein ALO70_05735 [Pseudomonas amygdali pv. eriobotryae]|uniref:Uncharacterized protein n=1 Tax=Pseudomonas amygdali pv. eriobotryae TaxID=129137 RepID=A0A0N8RG74_PSEA0|nr:Uncharacterized protein ALO70_05735 [Pseudomonas amygdali pv. eriobotryae]
MADIRVAPADDKGLQAVLERILHKAVGWAEVEDVELVDLRRHDQDRSAELPFAHRPILDQLEHFVAKHHRTGRGRYGSAYLKSVLGGLAGQPAVVQQIIGHVAQALDQAGTTRVEQLFDGLRVEQRIGRGQRIVDQCEQKVRARTVFRGQIAVINPLPDLMLAAEIHLQTPAIKRVETPGRVGEAGVFGIVRIGCFAQHHHPPQLLAQCQSMASATKRVPQTLGCDVAQGRKQVSPAQAGDGALRVDEVCGCSAGNLRRFFLHEGNTPSSGNSWVGASPLAKGLASFCAVETPVCCAVGDVVSLGLFTLPGVLALSARSGRRWLRVHDCALPFLLQKTHDDRCHGFGTRDQEQMPVIDDV